MTYLPAPHQLLVEPDAPYQTGDTTPTAALASALQVIESRENEVRAFTSMSRAAAQSAAAHSSRRWLEGAPLSPVDGMIIAVKDVFETADMPTGQGSPIWEGFETRRDGAAIQALREAGAIIIGKTTTTEFATSFTFADTKNPHDTARTPGGSSSGSAAAVGAGMVAGALGTQVVGSTLRPASYCGAVGFKPSFGALNRGGANDQLSHSCIGTIASTLTGAWSMAQAISSRVGGDPGCISLRGPERLPPARPAAAMALLKTAGWSAITSGAMDQLNQELGKLRLAGVSIISADDDADLARLEELLTQAWHLTMQILAWEFAWPLRSYPYERLSPTMQQRADAGRAMTVAHYESALEQRTIIRDLYAQISARVDCFVTLGATGAAPRLDDSTGSPAMNVPASLLGVPAVSLPILSDQGLPLGLQLIGRMHEDPDLMALARWRLETLS